MKVAEALNHSALESGEAHGVLRPSPPPAQEGANEMHSSPIGAATGAHPEVRGEEDALVPRRLLNLSKSHLAACWQDHFLSIFFPMHSRSLLRARNRSTPIRSLVVENPEKIGSELGSPLKTLYGIQKRREGVLHKFFRVRF